MSPAIFTGPDAGPEAAAGVGFEGFKTGEWAWWPAYRVQSAAARPCTESLTRADGRGGYTGAANATAGIGFPPAKRWGAGGYIPGTPRDVDKTAVDGAHVKL